LKFFSGIFMIIMYIPLSAITNVKNEMLLSISGYKYKKLLYCRKIVIVHPTGNHSAD